MYNFDMPKLEELVYLYKNGVSKMCFLNIHVPHNQHFELNIDTEKYAFTARATFLSYQVS